MDSELLALLETPEAQDPERFVRRALARCEAVSRRIALVALFQWARLGLPPSLDLYEPVTNAIRGTFGGWNQLIFAITKNVRHQRNSGAPEIRSLLTDTHALGELTALWGRVLETGTSQHLDALATSAFAAKRRLGRPTFGTLMERLTEVRNRIAHDHPDRAEYWTGLAAVLRPILLVVAHQQRPRALDADLDAAAPWLLLEDGQVLEFARLDQQLNSLFLDQKGLLHDRPLGASVRQAVQGLLDLDELKAKRFNDLLASLPPDSERGVVIGDFLLLHPLKAQGQQAHVFAGRQLSTGRRCAVKVLRNDADEEARIRLERESTYLGSVKSDHVVEILFSGPGDWFVPRHLTPTDDWHLRYFGKERRGVVRFFIALEWIDGETLDEVIKSRAPLSPETYLSWFEQAAEGLQAIHTVNIVHRDIKPANIMVTIHDVVKIMDLGLGHRRATGEEAVTTVGTIVGTYAYMSPEQVRATEADSAVEAPSDIYSLCATFFEVFTRRRFLNHDQRPDEAVLIERRADPSPPIPSDVARRVTEQSRHFDATLIAGLPPDQQRHFRTPDELRKVIASGISKEIDAVLRGGLEPDVQSRYQTAEALRVDIERCRKSEPILHSPPSLQRRLLLMYRRHRRTSQVAAALVFLLITASIVYAVQINTERQRTRAQYADLLFEKGRQDALADRPVEASVYLTEALGQGIYPTPTRLLLGSTLAAVEALRVQLGSETDPVGRPHFSNDGELISAVRSDGSIAIHRSSDGSRIGVIRATEACSMPGPPSPGIFSQDGTLLFRACGTTGYVFRVDELRLLCEAAGHSLDVTSVAFSPDGRFFAMGSTDDTATLWSLPACEPLATLDGHTATVNAVMFSPDSSLLATGSNDGTVRVWSVPDRRVIRILEQPGAQFRYVSFSQDSRLLTGAGTGITVWDAETGAMISTKRGALGGLLAVGGEGANSVAVMYSDADASYVVVDLPTGATRWVMEGREIYAAAIRPDGRQIAVGGADRTIKIYDSISGRQLGALYKRKTGLPSARLIADPSGELLAASDDTGAVDLWAWPDSLGSFIPDDQLTKVAALGFDRNSDAFLILHTDGQLDRCCAETDEPVHLLDVRDPIVTARFDAEGDRLAVLQESGLLSVFNLATDQTVWRMPSGARPLDGMFLSDKIQSRDRRWLRFDARGDTLLFIDEQGTVRGFQSSDGASLGDLRFDAKDAFAVHDVVCQEQLSGCLAIGLRNVPGGGLTELLYDFEQRRIVQQFTGHRAPGVLWGRFSTDGSLVMTSGWDGTAFIFDVLTGRAVSTLAGHDEPVISTALTEDRSVAATTTPDGTVRLWDIRLGVPLKIMKTGISARSVGFNYRGDMLVVGANGQLKVLPVPHESRSLPEIRSLMDTRVGWRLVSGRIMQERPVAASDKASSPDASR